MIRFLKFSFLALCLFLTAPATAGLAAQNLAPLQPGQADHPAPIYLEEAARGLHLVDRAFFMLDPEGKTSIEQAGSPRLQERYSRLAEGIPLQSSGVLWLRFSILRGQAGQSTAGPAGTMTQAAQATPAAPVLRLPPGTPPARLYVAQEFARNGDVRRWREINANASGDFPLPDPRNLPLTVYVKFDGVPGLWFNPQIIDPARASSDSLSGLAVYLPLAVQIFLALGILVLLLRGLSGRGEWRLWGAAILSCALVQAIFCRQAPELGRIFITSLPPLLAPGLLVMLAPHLGRHLLQSREQRGTDALLLVLSLPGAAVALLPLLPGLGWSAKLLPLAPLLLLPLLFPAVLALLRRKRGAGTYFLVCLLLSGGAALALLGLGLARFELAFDNPLYLLGPQLTCYGFAAAALVLMLSSPAKKAREAKEDFFPLELSAVNAFHNGGDPDLKLFVTPRPAEDEETAPENLYPAFRENASPIFKESAGADSEAEPEAGPVTEAETGAGAISKTGQKTESETGSKAGARPGPLRLAPIDLENDLPPLPELPAWEAAPSGLPMPGRASTGKTAAAPGSWKPPVPPEPAQATAQAETSPQIQPPRQVEDAIGGSMLNFMDMLRVKDAEEPGLVILKPALQPEPPAPAKNGPEAETAGPKFAPAAAPAAAPDKAAGEAVDEEAGDEEELLELTELVEQAAAPELTEAPAEPELTEAAELIETPETPELAEVGAAAETPELAEVPAEPEQAEAAEVPEAADIAEMPEATELAETPEAAAVAPDPADQGQAVKLGDPGEQSEMVKQPDPVENQPDPVKLDEPDDLAELDIALDNLDRLARAEALQIDNPKIFNLSNLVREIHAEIIDQAEERGIALSWFVSPSLDMLYKGDEDTLRITLRHLLRGAVESARDGAIQLAVRQAPEGDNLVRFRLTDSALTPDSPRPPARLLSRAWELACASQGTFNVEFVPDRGTSINFSLKLKPLSGSDYAAITQRPPAPPAAADPKEPQQPAPESTPEIVPETAPVSPVSPAQPAPAVQPVSESAAPAPAPPVSPAQPAPSPAPEYHPDGLPFGGENAEDLDGPLDPEDLDGVSLSSTGPAAPLVLPERNTIIVADRADSGRRLILRRLEGLPYSRLEASSMREVLQACSWGNVALIILDAEMPGPEIRAALTSLSADAAEAGLPPIPSLCLLAHASQSERMFKAGCSACQVKSESRETFQNLVRRLAPQNADDADLAARTQTQISPPAGLIKPARQQPDRSVPLLDLIVSSLDSESAELNLDAATRRMGEDRPEAGGDLAPVYGEPGEYMAAAMLPLLPGFLDILREELRLLEQGVAKGDFNQIKESTLRMQSQSRTYGLSTLQRMAACVERAAQARDREAVHDLAEELARLCRRYLESLRETHERFTGK